MKKLRSVWEHFMEKEWFVRLWQLVKFAVVGVSNTVISVGVYELCVNLFRMHYIPADAIGLAVSVINAYYWNNRVVFGDGEKKSFPQHLAGYFRSLTAYGGTFLLDSALLFLWVDVLHISASLAPFLNLIITIPLNFLVNKYWTFKKRGTSAHGGEQTDSGDK